MLDVFPENNWRDYETRRKAFEASGVIEYVGVQLTNPISWVWNRLIDNRFVEIETADDELIMSAALPGLWIPTQAFKQRDWWSIMGTIARGVSREGHHDFMNAIWKAGKP